MYLRLDLAVASSHIFATKTNGIGEEFRCLNMLQNELNESNNCAERSIKACPVSNHFGGSELLLPSTRSSSIFRAAKNLIGSFCYPYFILPFAPMI